MFQQGGYGQIYGIGVGGGGGAVGAAVYDTSVENVRFARMVERQKLAIQRRAISLQEAQLKANQKAQQQRYNLETLQLQLQDRRLVMADQQQQRAEDAALRNYDLAMRKFEADRQQQAFANELALRNAARLEEGQKFSQDLALQNAERQAQAQEFGQEMAIENAERQADAQLFSQEMALRNAERQEMSQEFNQNLATAQLNEQIRRGQEATRRQDVAEVLAAIEKGAIFVTDKDGKQVASPGGFITVTLGNGQKVSFPYGSATPAKAATKFTDRESAQMKILERQVKQNEERKKQAEKDIAKLDEEISAAKQEAEGAKGKAREAMDEGIAQLEAKRADAEGKLKDSFSQKMLSDYQIRAAQDTSLLKDIPLNKWRDMDWDGLDRDSKPDRQNIIRDCLYSDRPVARQMLAAIVNRKGDFDAWSARMYLNAVAAYPDVGGRPSPAEWLEIPWNRIDGSGKGKLGDLLVHGAENPVETAARIEVLAKRLAK